MIDAESKFQKDNASILAWITTANQKREHHLLREKLGVDDVYKRCGKWLFETRQYCNWEAAQGTSNPVLWLKGTGRRNQYLYNDSLRETNIHCSGNWKDNFDVREISPDI